MQERDIDIRERDQSPIDDALVQLHEVLEGLGQTIDRLENRLHMVINNNPRKGGEDGTIKEMTPSSDSPLLVKIRLLISDLTHERDRVSIIIGQLDI